MTPIDRHQPVDAGARDDQRLLPASDATKARAAAAGTAAVPISVCRVPHEDDSSLGDLPICPVCGGMLIEIRQKWQCERCHTICQTCCEGGRG